MIRLRRRGRALTLLEVIVALGVLAVGATVAFALLIAAAAAGRRAEHQVNAALIAETILNDTVLEENLRLEDLEEAPSPGGAVPAAPAGAPGAAASAGVTRYLEKDATWKSQYPGYKYNVTITALPGPVPNEPWHYLLEGEVRWSEKGRRRSAAFSTVRLKTLTHRLNPQPTPRRRRGRAGS